MNSGVNASCPGVFDRAMVCNFLIDGEEDALKVFDRR